MLRPHVHRLAGAGIAAGPRVTGPHRQGAEPTQLNATAAFQRLDHPLEDHPHHPLDITLGEVWIFLGELGDQLRLDHATPSKPA